MWNSSILRKQKTIFLRSVWVIKTYFDMSGSVLQSDPSQLSNINTVKIEKMKALQFIMDEQVLILQACITK